MLRFWGVCLLLICLPLEVYGKAPDLTLASASATLVWNGNGMSVRPKTQSPAVAGLPRPVWAVRLIQVDKTSAAVLREINIDDTDQSCEQRKLESGYELYYPKLVKGQETFDISCRMTLLLEGDSFRIDAELNNHSENWIVLEMTAPVLNDIQADLQEYPLLWPDCLGLKVSGIGEHSPWRRTGNELEITAVYPGLFFNMQYMTFAGKEGGLWLGCPDPERAAKRFRVSYNTDQKTLKAAVDQLCCVHPGTVWKKTIEEIHCYSGDWHKAADHYRARCSSWIKAGEQKPQWLDDLTGMFLVIMNQQNNRHTMWRYDEIGAKMTEDAFAQGFNMIGLFGWHKGGHDALFPLFEADELLGGRQALKDGIAAAHKRGQKVCLLENGQLIDYALTDYLNGESKKLVVVNRDGSRPEETWTMHDDTPPHVFGRACLLSETWFQIQLDLAKDANELGADGILYDQISIGGPMPCYSPEHGHPVPAMTHGTSGAILMQRVDREMKKINPNFIVMTEGFNDASVDSCSFYHSYGSGLYGTPALESIRQWRDGTGEIVPFRSLFLYTWPEAVLTIRNPIPLQHRRNTNMACVLGLKHEVEVRFPADVEALASGHLADRARYEQDHLSKSRLGTLVLDAFAGRDTRLDMAYTKTMAEFRQKYSDLLLAGRFCDTVGFTCSGKVLATAFEGKDRFGVIVWNPEEEPVAFSVNVPGKKLVEAASPETGLQSDPFADLPPCSVRLLIWQ
ncbi:MAG: DUF6259 domain-containing protein [Planctomycetia bacterium]|nr:DUF6259 domain-containing protein [Planctomycetia bacterium]